MGFAFDHSDKAGEVRPCMMGTKSAIYHTSFCIDINDAISQYLLTITFANSLHQYCILHIYYIDYSSS